VVFKRRDKRSAFKVVFSTLWPIGGWSRAFQYVKHRLRRLPDTPESIARGIWAGVFATFTPLYGLHFLVALIIARICNGNILASLLGTFFGNPLTYFPIGVISIKTGNFLLGNQTGDPEKYRSFVGKFLDAGRDLQTNIGSVFSGKPADWSNLVVFYDEFFFPFLIGGIAPGIVVASISYFLTVPIIRAYQKRRKGALREKLLSLKKKKPKSNDERV
jgi:hypothetical protein